MFFPAMPGSVMGREKTKQMEQTSPVIRSSQRGTNAVVALSDQAEPFRWVTGRCTDRGATEANRVDLVQDEHADDARALFLKGNRTKPGTWLKLAKRSDDQRVKQL
jgi:hypothetical protein